VHSAGTVLAIEMRSKSLSSSPFGLTQWHPTLFNVFMRFSSRYGFVFMVERFTSVCSASSPDRMMCSGYSLLLSHRDWRPLTPLTLHRPPPPWPFAVVPLIGVRVTDLPSTLPTPRKRVAPLSEKPAPCTECGKYRASVFRFNVTIDIYQLEENFIPYLLV
jgi:hypothetical protein